MVTTTTLRAVQYPPELLPASWFGDVALGSELSAPVVDLKTISAYLPALANIQLTANSAVRLRSRYDNVRIDVNTAAFKSGYINKFFLPAKNQLSLTFFGDTGAPVASFTTHFGVWVRGGGTVSPSIADKLLAGITLTSDEEAIAEELGIEDTYNKGLFPLPLNQMIDREYRVIGEETHSKTINIAAADTTYTIEYLHPQASDEFIVLTEVAAEPGTTAEDVIFKIERDSNYNYIELPTYALSLNDGGAIPCFIPAMTEIRLTAIATTAPGNHSFRYTYKRIKLSNILRVRFGLITKDELPEESLWNKVVGGIV